MLNHESCLGGAKVEGIVVKAYGRFTRDGKTMMGKYVSEVFKEKHVEDWKLRNPGSGDRVTQIINMLRTEARWQKAVQHLREQGVLLGEPKDIGPLIGELKRDLFEEELDWLKQRLFKEFIDDVVRGVLRGFPEWYKEKLLERAFDAVN